MQVQLQLTEEEFKLLNESLLKEYNHVKWYLKYYKKDSLEYQEQDKKLKSIESIFNQLITFKD